MRKHGIERVPPIVRRGILLDVAGAEGVDILPNDFAITADVAQAVAREHGVQVRAGDAFLVRTGLMRRWNDPEFLDFENGQPGVTADCAEWLAETGVYLGGSDTMTFEFIPAGDDHLPVHGIFLVDNGIYILENADLESLAAADVHEFPLCHVAPQNRRRHRLARSPPCDCVEPARDQGCMARRMQVPSNRIASRFFRNAKSNQYF